GSTPRLLSWSRRRFTVGGIALGLLGPLAHAQDSPVRILTGFPGGSIVDTMARGLAEALRAQLGRPVIVDSRPGAAGRLAVEAAKQARPDGDTLLLVPQGPMTLFPHVFSGLRYDPVKDFIPLAQLATFDFALGVAPPVPAASLAELKAWLIEHPAQASFASPGVGTIPHFLGERYAERIGVKMVHVPFKSAGEMVAAVMGGQVPMAFSPIGDFLEAFKAGRLKVLATSGSRRVAQTPQVPTFVESGIDLQIGAWLGLYTVAGVLEATVQRLERPTLQVMQTPALRSLLAASIMVPAGANNLNGVSGGELARLQASETRAWADIVKRSGFKPEP
ncbi:MAG: tripartite tricarboxylate transporter family receptor, partial [Rhodoferax sp.]|nr:tripartite tricarboxylate transporter family receptor [Rhodoferax sp.]